MDMTAAPLPFGKRPVDSNTRRVLGDLADDPTILAAYEADAVNPRRELSLDEYCATQQPCACGAADTQFSTEYEDLRWICVPCRDKRRERMSR